MAKTIIPPGLMVASISLAFQVDSSQIVDARHGGDVEPRIDMVDFASHATRQVRQEIQRGAADVV